MKLIRRTIKKTCDRPFFTGKKEFYNYLDLLNVLYIDRSCTFHDDNKTLYIIEIVPDHLIDIVNRYWAEVITAEGWSGSEFVWTEGTENVIKK